MKKTFSPFYKCTKRSTEGLTSEGFNRVHQTGYLWQ